MNGDMSTLPIIFEDRYHAESSIEMEAAKKPTTTTTEPDTPPSSSSIKPAPLKAVDVSEIQPIYEEIHPQVI